MYLAFLWHMHQPVYKDPQAGYYRMPWVYLHGVRDYYDMVARLDRYSHFKCNVNLVPSLLMQLDDYQQPRVKDRFLLAAKRPAAELEPVDRAFLLEHFFSLNWETMVKPYARYRELLQKRRAAARGEGIWDIAQFSLEDYRDLQVWFYLAWSGEALRGDPAVRRLLSKGQDFSEGEKEELFEAQRLLLAKIVPLYRRLHDSGQIELSCSPLYHPILPLLCDTRSARVASPEVALPEAWFCHPEDSEYQMREAVRYMAERLQVRPRGMWPSEGAISPQTAGQMIDAGLTWTASDETVLQRSLGSESRNAHLLPYRFAKGGRAIAIFFRDRTLSDLIGFTYSQWPAREAAADLVSRLQQIAPPAGPRAVVSIILDGENAWDYYPESGREFWETFFTLLEARKEIEPITFSEYLDRHPAQSELAALHTGSWINGDLRVWIGHPEKNRAWDLLAETRATAAARATAESDPGAWDQIYAAEGSDWFWWYGDDHYSAYRDEFDLLFRKHLQHAYEALGLPIPAALFQPILESKVYHAIEPPVAKVRPVLDGQVSDYFEWLGAGSISSADPSATVHYSQSVLKRVLFGFNDTDFCLRLDPVDAAAVVGEEGRWKFEVCFKSPEGKVEITGSDGSFLARLVREGKTVPLSSLSVGKIVELAIPLERLDGIPGRQIHWFIQIWRDGRPLERWPRTGVFSLILDLDREQRAWLV